MPRLRQSPRGLIGGDQRGTRRGYMEVRSHKDPRGRYRAGNGAAYLAQVRGETGKDDSEIPDNITNKYQDDVLLSRQRKFVGHP
jgi:hypothetical protein